MNAKKVKILRNLFDFFKMDLKDIKHNNISIYRKTKKELNKNKSMTRFEMREWFNKNCI